MAFHSHTSEFTESKTSVDLFIECTNLKDKDILTRSDPCAVFYMSLRGGKMTEIGRTEILKNTLNPKFAWPIRTEYLFEEVQKVKIEVYDIDNVTKTLKDDDRLGTVECTLAQIITGRPFRRSLRGKKGEAGQIMIRVTEVDNVADTVTITFDAKNLDDKDVVTKSDPFLEIKKPTADGTWQVVHRTEVIENNLNPKWKPFTISVQKLCDGDKNKQIKIDCFDYDDNGYHDYIGGFTTNLEEMMKPSSEKAGFACINQKYIRKKKKNYINSGVVHISCKLSQAAKEKAFIDFVLGGLQINFTVGIDFTQSNGDPKERTSLHYISPTSSNEYMLAIKAVGEICQDYDTDNFFPAFGFGAKLCPSSPVSHDFPINFDSHNPNCAGIDGILNAYVHCVQKVELFGPTIVTPIINHVARNALAAQQAESTKGAHAYHVLLLLTDGIFNDVPDVKQAIVHASNLPMSIITVGVGIADFSDMKELMVDSGHLTLLSGEKAKRNIVQFVPFVEFKQRTTADLARHVMGKIPNQIIEYFKMRGLHPNQPRYEDYNVQTTWAINTAM